jgi:hypothetical protein
MHYRFGGVFVEIIKFLKKSILPKFYLFLEKLIDFVGEEDFNLEQKDVCT